MARTAFPGDAVIPNANMIYDQHITIPSRTPSQCFPWLLQLGCGRAGWYLPFVIERWIVPGTSCASRSVQQRWTQLQVGDVVFDYRMPVFDKEQPSFEVVEVKRDSGEGEGGGISREERYVVYKSQRYGAVFSWTLMARPAEGVDGTTVHLRFRGKIAATRLKARLIVWGGGIMDYLSTAPMLWGLKDRVLAEEKEHGE
jgi:hypothetical protein